MSQTLRLTLPGFSNLPETAAHLIGSNQTLPSIGSKLAVFRNPPVNLWSRLFRAADLWEGKTACT